MRSLLVDLQKSQAADPTQLLAACKAVLEALPGHLNNNISQRVEIAGFIINVLHTLNSNTQAFAFRPLSDCLAICLQWELIHQLPLDVSRSLMYYVTQHSQQNLLQSDAVDQYSSVRNVILRSFGSVLDPACDPVRFRHHLRYVTYEQLVFASHQFMDRFASPTVEAIIAALLLLDPRTPDLRSMAVARMVHDILNSFASVPARPLSPAFGKVKGTYPAEAHVIETDAKVSSHILIQLNDKALWQRLWDVQMSAFITPLQNEVALAVQLTSWLPQLQIIGNCLTVTMTIGLAHLHDGLLLQLLHAWDTVTARALSCQFLACLIGPLQAYLDHRQFQTTEDTSASREHILHRIFVTVTTLWTNTSAGGETETFALLEELLLWCYDIVKTDISPWLQMNSSFLVAFVQWFEKQVQAGNSCIASDQLAIMTGIARSGTKGTLEVLDQYYNLLLARSSKNDKPTAQDENQLKAAILVTQAILVDRDEGATAHIPLSFERVDIHQTSLDIAAAGISLLLWYADSPHRFYDSRTASMLCRFSSDIILTYGSKSTNFDLESIKTARHRLLRALLSIPIDTSSNTIMEDFYQTVINLVGTLRVANDACWDAVEMWFTRLLIFSLSNGIAVQGAFKAAQELSDTLPQAFPHLKSVVSAWLLELTAQVTANARQTQAEVENFTILVQRVTSVYSKVNLHSKSTLTEQIIETTDLLWSYLLQSAFAVPEVFSVTKDDDLSTAITAYAITSSFRILDSPSTANAISNLENLLGLVLTKYEELSKWDIAANILEALVSFKSQGIKHGQLLHTLFASISLSESHLKSALRVEVLACLVFAYDICFPHDQDLPDMPQPVIDLVVSGLLANDSELVQKSLDFMLQLCEALFMFDDLQARSAQIRHLNGFTDPLVHFVACKVTDARMLEDALRAIGQMCLLLENAAFRSQASGPPSLSELLQYLASRSAAVPAQGRLAHMMPWHEDAQIVKLLAQVRTF